MESSNSVMQVMPVMQAAELKDKYEKVLEKESDLEKHLLKIQEHYWTKKTCYSGKCEAAAQRLLMTILTDNDLKEIHSARYRMKSIDSLWVKYVKKKALLADSPGSDYNIEKYRTMTKDNYYKVITDLIGIRILIRYQQQWETVHEWIWHNFYKEDKPYIQNWLDDYPSGETEDFLVEKPKLYLREEKDYPMYQKYGKDIFEKHISNEGYSSIHYLLWYDGKYVELQVRTIYDEAWGECTHDLVYKCKNKTRRADLERLSECLATQTQAAGMIADIMYEKSQDVSSQADDMGHSMQKVKKIQKSGYEKIQKHLDNMNNSKEKQQEFDGAIDNLI